ncbi:MAG: nickel pincer cofactor biosynthesis protein LarC [Candidatus Desulforudis sp.]|nr:nickel pincer cofactor biosynthesis protein LarC [Desulforudis sp.]
MRTLYWDCFAGISGDMALGSLIDAGADPEQIRALLGRLSLPGWTLAVREERRGGLRGARVEVRVTADQPDRRLPDILELLNSAGLPAPVPASAGRVFARLAEAEARVHGISPDLVHFHEVGAVDAIMEVTGTVIALHLLGVERVEVSPLPLSRGFVKCAHGILPVPAPAVLELIRGFPTRTTDIEGELVTPTGAALAITLSAAAGDFPPGLVIDRLGYGAGTATAFPFPNHLRAVIGVTSAAAPAQERLAVLETILDDVNPEYYPFFLERLKSAGARDAYLAPLIMKKGRPGIKLTVLAGPDEWQKLLTVILRETGTLGVRVRHEQRVVLERKILQVETAYGPVRVKVSSLDGAAVRVKPEFEDCRALALRHGVPVREIVGTAERAAAEAFSARGF